jgi:hypothetical protein
MTLCGTYSGIFAEELLSIPRSLETRTKRWVSTFPQRLRVGCSASSHSLLLYSRNCDGINDLGRISDIRRAKGDFLKERSATEHSRRAIRRTDHDGSLATLTYPNTGKVITYTPGGAGMHVPPLSSTKINDFRASLFCRDRTPFSSDRLPGALMRYPPTQTTGLVDRGRITGPVVMTAELKDCEPFHSLSTGYPEEADGRVCALLPLRFILPTSLCR